MKEKKKQYSVLMSVYGKEKPGFLRDSMNSIYSQTIPTNDFVLVCDGPLTSELDDVINDMSKKFGKRFRTIRLSKNHGLGYALNVGLEECKNDFVARMDSDDISVEDRIEKQLRIFEEEDADVVGGNIAEYDSDMIKMTGCRCVPEKNDEILKVMKKRNAVNHVTTMYRKEKVIEAGNYLDMPGFEDYYLWIRMIKKGCKFYNIQENLVKVRCGDEMIRRRGGKGYVKQINNFEKAIFKLGFISFPNYLMNVSERALVSVIPEGARSFIYKKILRK